MKMNVEFRKDDIKKLNDLLNYSLDQFEKFLRDPDPDPDKKGSIMCEIDKTRNKINDFLGSTDYISITINRKLLL